MYSHDVALIAVNTTLASITTNADLVQPFDSYAFAYDLVSSTPALSFAAIAANTTNATCVATFNKQNYSCTDNTFSSIALSQTKDPLTVTLFVPTDKPISTTTYTFELEQVLCFVYDFTLVDSPESCVVVNSNNQSYATVCTIESTAPTATVQYSTSGNCSNVVLQYNAGGTWTPCAGNACALIGGDNQFQVSAVNTYNASITTVATLSVANGKQR